MVKVFFLDVLRCWGKGWVNGCNVRRNGCAGRRNDRLMDELLEKKVGE